MIIFYMKFQNLDKILEDGKGIIFVFYLMENSKN